MWWDYGRRSYTQNYKLRFSFVYCHAWYGYWFWCRRWSWPLFQRWDYLSHEFRNIPKGHQDWFGMRYHQAFNVHYLGTYTRISASDFNVEYKWENHMGATKDWNIYSNDNVPNKLRPHRGQPGYGTNCRRKYHFSWEKKRTCVTGYWHCWGWRRCRWVFRTFIDYVWWWTWWRWSRMYNINTLRFPVAMKLIKFRVKGSGQKFAGYQWWYHGWSNAWSAWNRHVVLRSLKKIDGSPTCLVDSSKYSRGSNRMVLMQSCSRAAENSFGAEIFRMWVYPNYRTWEREHGQIMYAEKDMPYLRRAHARDRNTMFERVNHNSLRSKRLKQCISTTKDEYKYLCGKNMNISASSFAKVKDNNPCNLGLEKPKKFQFMPNDLKMKLFVSLNARFAQLKTITIDFEKGPKAFRVYCYNDLWRRWNMIYIVVNGKKDKHKIPVSAEYCTYISIVIMKLDKKKHKCKEGLCLTVNSIKLDTDIYFLKYGKCMEKDEKNEDVRFFEEPSNVYTSYRARRTLYRMGKQSSKFKNKLNQMYQFKEKIGALRSNLNSNFSVDIPTDTALSLEKCEKGPCLKKVKKPNLPKFYKNLLYQKGRFGSMKVEGAGIGEASSDPSPNCTMIKKLNNTNMNGFYWIKNNCSRGPSKVFCLNSHNYPKGYIIQNSHEYLGINILKAHNIVKPELFKDVCSKGGFDIAKISDEYIAMDTLILTLLYGFHYHTESGIAMGYDFSCGTYKGCTGEYYSLDGGTKLNNVAIKINKKLGKEFIPIKNNELLLFHNGQFKTVSFSKAKVNSVLCETIDEIGAQPLECGVSFDDLNVLDSNIIACKKDCSRESYAVKGNVIYSSDSSVCKSLMHSGDYLEIAGLYFAMVSTQKSLMNNFPGGVRNGIMAVASSKQSKAFKFSKINSQCPKERIQILRSLSFLSTKSDEGDGDYDDELSLSDLRKLNRLMTHKKHRNNNKLKNRLKNLLNSINYDSDSDEDNKVIEDLSYLLNKSKKQNNRELYSSMVENRVDRDHYIHYAGQNSAKDGLYNDMTMYDMYNGNIDDPKINYNKKDLHRFLRNHIKRSNKFKMSQIPEELQAKVSIAAQSQNSKHLRNNKGSTIKFIREMNKIFKVDDVKYDDFVFREEIRPEDLKDNKMLLQQMNKSIDNHIKIYQQYGENGTQNTKFMRFLKKLYNFTENNPNIKKKMSFDQSIISTDNSDNDTNKNDEIEQEDFDDMRFRSKKKWQKDYPKHYIDLQSEVTANKDYYGEKNPDKHASRKFFTKDGDDTNLHTLVKRNSTSGKDIDEAKKVMNKFREDKKFIMKYLSKNEKSLKEAEKLIDPLRKDYLQLSLFGLLTLRQANKELKMTQKTLELLEDKYLGLFKYVDVDYVVDIVKGVSIPLPDYWVKLNYKGSSEDDTIIKVTKDKVSPHTSALKIFSNPIEKSTDLGVILFTRYHRTFDGSLHFSMFVSKKKSIVGCFFRYTDQFVNYQLKFVPEKGLMYVILNNPFQFKIIAVEKVQVNIGAWTRVVIKFEKFKFKIWVNPETSTPKDTLDEDQRKAELSSKRNLFQVYDPGLKEGRIGFFCSDCQNTLFSSIQLWSDKCIVNQDKSLYKLISKKNVIYTESYTGNAVNVFKQTIARDSTDVGELIFAPTNGVKHAIINTKPTRNKTNWKGAAQINEYKTPGFICFDNCSEEVSMLFKDAKQGLAYIAFKYSNPIDHYAISIHRMKKDKIYLRLIQVKSRLKVLTSKLIPGSCKGWVKIRIWMQQDKVSVYINDKQLITKYQINGFQKLKGGYAFGTNNLVAAFSKIKFKALPTPEELRKLAAKKAAAAAAGMNGPVGGDGGMLDMMDGGEVLEEESADSVEESVEYICLQNNTMDTRKKWCESYLKKDDKNVDGCVQIFPEICCNNYVKPTSLKTCVIKVKASTIKAPLTDFSIFDACYKQEEGENNDVKLAGCKSCCASIFKPDYMSTQTLSISETKCYQLYGEENGVAGLGGYSLLSEGYRDL